MGNRALYVARAALGCCCARCDHPRVRAALSAQVPLMATQTPPPWPPAPASVATNLCEVHREFIKAHRFATRRQAMEEVIDWMTFYNHRRIQSTLGYVSLMQFERSWLAAQRMKAA